MVNDVLVPCMCTHLHVDVMFDCCTCVGSIRVMGVPEHFNIPFHLAEEVSDDR